MTLLGGFRVDLWPAQSRLRAKNDLKRSILTEIALKCDFVAFSLVWRISVLGESSSSSVQGRYLAVAGRPNGRLGQFDQVKNDLFKVIFDLVLPDLAKSGSDQGRSRVRQRDHF